MLRKFVSMSLSATARRAAAKSCKNNILLSSNRSSTVNYFSSSSGDDKVKNNTTSSSSNNFPDDFFDTEGEKDQLFLDLAEVISKTGSAKSMSQAQGNVKWTDFSLNSRDELDKYNTTDGLNKNEFSKKESNELWDDISKGDHQHKFNLRTKLRNSSREERQGLRDSHASDKDKGVMDAVAALSDSTLSGHMDSMSSDVVFTPPEMLNYTMPWKKQDELEIPELQNFIPNDEPEKYMYGKAGNRTCTGKKQKIGLKAKLKCHLIDISTLTHMDTFTLKRFVSSDSEILPRIATGLCSKCQRAVARTIRRARSFGFMPHIGISHLYLSLLSTYCLLSRGICGEGQPAGGEQQSGRGWEATTHA